MKQFDNLTMKQLSQIFFITLFFVLPIPVLAKKVALPVPFSAQAPDGKWVEPWRNACEETSTTLIDFYYSGYQNKQIKISDAQKKILELVNLENKLFGFNKDTNAAQIAELINNYLPWEAYVVENPSLDQLKQELNNKHPIIIVAHGKDLHNPHYKSDQIDYHTLVLSGYDDDTQEFISQEPATRFGLDYRYTYDTIMNAMHDFLPKDQTYRGRKVAVFTRKELVLSSDIDADKDGLSKADELRYGTILWLQDSDGDGYKDGVEVVNGYSPTLAENKISHGDLIKVARDPRIYLVQNGKRHHITSMDVMRRHGWDNQKIKPVSQKYLNNYFPKGADITW